MFPVLKASDFKHFANGVLGPGFFLHSLVCTMLGSHQLPGSRCTIALLRQEWGWEESSLAVSPLGVHPWGLSPALRLPVSGLKLTLWVLQVLANSSLT